MREIPEIVDRAANAASVSARGEWERDRKAWNLPRAPRDLGAASTKPLTNEVPTAADVHPAAAHRAIQGLPQDLSELDRDELREASDTRDERLSILFRRWPSLNKPETREIRKLHDERQRLARFIGLVRNGGRGVATVGLPGNGDDKERLPKTPPAPS